MPRRQAYSVADETDLTFSGLIAFNDPPLADAAETLAALRADGVEVKILTGDNELVATHVCMQAGLARAVDDRVLAARTARQGARRRPLAQGR